MLLVAQSYLLDAHHSPSPLQDISLLLPAVDALALLLFPLQPCGLLIPYLPESLHPDPLTLIHDSPDPFLIGLHSRFYDNLFAAAPPTDDDNLVVVSLDAGFVTCAPDALRHLLRTPLLRTCLTDLRRELASSSGCDAIAVRSVFIELMAR